MNLNFFHIFIQTFLLFVYCYDNTTYNVYSWLFTPVTKVYVYWREGVLESHYCYYLKQASVFSLFVLKQFMWMESSL